MEKIAKRIRTVRNVFMPLMPLCFIAFIVMQIVATVNKYGNEFLPIVFAPFILMVICAFGLGIAASRVAIYDRAMSVVNTVKSQDKILIAQLGKDEEKGLELVKKLLDTGNLSEYSLVADVILVREGTFVSESEAKREYGEYKNSISSEEDENKQ